MPEEIKTRKLARINKQPSSGLSAFIERPIPSDHEVASFERVVEREARQQEIDSNLEAIYRDNKGGLVDVKKLKMKRKRNLIIKLFRNLMILVLAGLAAYFLYFYYFSRGNDLAGVQLAINAPDSVAAGEEFSYQIEYKNPTKFPVGKVRLELQYPENFVFVGSSAAASTGNYGFVLPDLPSGGAAQLTVTGRLIGLQDSANVISGSLSYVPLNFSSEFRKEASDVTAIKSLGFQTVLSCPSSIFIGQDNDLSLAFQAVEDNQLGDFNLEFSLPSGASIALAPDATASSSPVLTGSSSPFSVSSFGPNVWLISGLSRDNSYRKITFNYQTKDNAGDSQVKVSLKKRLDDGQSYTFWEQQCQSEAVKSDLNLTLFLNGSKNDGVANFGDTLNYTLNYSNKGANTFKDVAIMAVLDSPFIDWSRRQVDDQGEAKDGRIIWNKAGLPGLAEIKPGDSGEINFSVPIKSFQSEFLSEKSEIGSYAQYGFDGKESGQEENKSNVINTKLNSDLSLTEKILYFDENNTPVGSGPLPPKVGEKSSFRVYWAVKNDLHELGNVQVALSLPAGVSWEGNASAGAGSIYYDEGRRSVIWNIGLMPLSVAKLEGSFTISILPQEADRDKIMVLSPGTAVSAFDKETNNNFTQKTEAKTTRLEDDDIANLNNSGRVQ